MNENDFNREMLGISCDLGADESCTVGYSVDMSGNIKIDWIKNTKKKKKVSSFNEICKTEYAKTIKKLMDDSLIKNMLIKEVKKVSRPYLETKVVKVKKCRHFLAKWMPGNIYKCCKCGKIVTERGHKPIKPKGNWVNNENLDKIKFPCFCSYSKDRYGVITKTYIGEERVIYTVHGIERQYFSLSSIKSYDNLEKLIKALDIHILKGKIILFEEEK